MDKPTEPAQESVNPSSTNNAVSATVKKPFRSFRPPAFKPPKRKDNTTVSSATSGVMPKTNLGTVSSGSHAQNKLPPGETAPCRYFSVMYCKSSMKKKKTYMDGILSLDGRWARLYDMEGKCVGKQHTRFYTLGCGESLGVGPYDIEVTNEVDKEEFESGRIFITSSSAVELTKKRTGSTFVNPVKNKKIAGTNGKGGFFNMKRRVRPRHDPFSSTALVLQWPKGSNKDTGAEAPLEDGSVTGPRGETFVPVIVDPCLASVLRPHQRAAVKFLWECTTGLKSYEGNGCILADEMGLGKTLSTITLIYTMLKQSVTGTPAMSKGVIVTPSSLVSNWKREFKKWLGDERCKPLAVTKADKYTEGYIQDFVNGGAEVFSVLILSYEMYRKFSNELTTASIGLLVCDEGHRLKNSLGNKTIAALNQCPTRRRVILSGTPIQNDLQEFYAMVSFVNPDVLGNLTTFRRVFETPIEKSRDAKASDSDKAIGEQRSLELSRLTDMFVLRRTSDTISKFLPPKVECCLFVNCSHLQRRLYAELLQSSLAGFLRNRAAETQASALQLLGYLKQLCNHPLLVWGRYDIDKHPDRDPSEAAQKLAGSTAAEAVSHAYPGVRTKSFAAIKELVRKGSVEFGKKQEYAGFLPSGLAPNLLHALGIEEEPEIDTVDAFVRTSSKLCLLDELLQSLIKSTKEKIVVVSHSTQPLDLISQLCAYRKMRFVRLDGKTASDERQTLVNFFNGCPVEECRVFLLSSKAGGTGLNLVGASRLVMFNVDWNPANDHQAMARIWREGQKQTCYIYRLFNVDTIEEKIYQRQLRKKELAMSIHNNYGEENSRNFTMNELKALFSVSPSKFSQETGKKLRCDTSEMMSRKSSEMNWPAYHGSQDFEDKDPVLTQALRQCGDTETVPYAILHREDPDEEKPAIEKPSREHTMDDELEAFVDSNVSTSEDDDNENAGDSLSASSSVTDKIHSRNTISCGKGAGIKQVSTVDALDREDEAEIDFL